MNKMQLGLIVATTLSQMACATTYRYTATTSVQAQPRPPGCAIQVLTVPPAVGYQELGMVELSSGIPAHTPEEFSKAIQDQVCALGGDVVVAQIDNRTATGVYRRDLENFVRGTVLKTGAAPVEADEQLRKAALATKAEQTAVTSIWTCKPEENPQWTRASAVEKKQIVEGCMKVVQP